MKTGEKPLRAILWLEGGYKGMLTAPVFFGYYAAPIASQRQRPCVRFGKQANSITAKQFANYAQSLGQVKPVSPEQLEAFLAGQSTTQLGELPKAIQALNPDNPDKIWQALDKLALDLRETDGKGKVYRARGVKPPEDRSINSLQKTASLKWLDEGGYGMAYTLHANNKTFVFKVFYYLDHKNMILYDTSMLVNGNFFENARGLQYASQPVKNLAQYYCGNPKTGWIINELITPDMKPQTRPGPWMHEIGIRSTDPKNNINNIIFEYGEINGGVDLDLLPKNMRWQAFVTALENPLSRPAAADDLFELPESLRKRAFDMAMTHPEARKTASARITMLPAKDRKAAFDTAMQYPETRVWALSAIDWLAAEDQQDALRQLEQCPEIPQKHYAIRNLRNRITQQQTSGQTSD